MAVADVLLHNWATSSSIETEWSTRRYQSHETAVEERVGLCERPRRTLSVVWEAPSIAVAQRLIMHLARMGDGEQGVPLYPDATLCTASGSASTDVFIDTTYRRFYAGGTVVLWERAAGTGQPTNVRTRVISSVTSTKIVVTVADTTTANSTLVAPVMNCQPVLVSEPEALTDRVVRVSATFREADADRIDASATHPLPEPEYTQYAIWSSLEERFLFDASPNWAASVSLGLDRPGDTVTVGRGGYVELRGARPFFRFGYELLHGSREDAWRVLKFFDAHRGSLVAFLVVNPATLFEAVAISTTYVDVDNVGPTSTEIGDYVKHVAIEKTDGTMYLAEVASVASNGSGDWRITFTTAISSMTLGQVRRVTSAHYCRFATDTLNEEWVTAGGARMSVALAEIERPT